MPKPVGNLHGQRPTPERTDAVLDQIEKEHGFEAVEDLLESLPEDDVYTMVTEGQDEPANPEDADD